MAGPNPPTRKAVFSGLDFQMSDQGYLVENGSWQDEIKKRAAAMAVWDAPDFDGAAEGVGFKESEPEAVAEPEPVIPDPKAAYEEAMDRARRESAELMDRMLREARARAESDADSIKKAAAQEVEHLRAEAEVKNREALEAARRQGEQAGRQQGLESGKAEGLVAGRAEGLREYEAKIREWDGLFKSAAEQRHRALADLEPMMVDLVGEALHRCLQREAQERPAMVVDLLGAALRMAHDRVHLRVHLNPEDVDRVRSVRDQLQLSVGAGELELVPDGRLEKGGCLLETEAGSVDARLGTLVSQAQDALKSGM